MNRTVVTIALSALALSASANVTAADTGVVSCRLSHYARANGIERVNSNLVFHNADRKKVLRIERITIRNAFGQIIKDTGPKAGIDHPLNGDFSTPLDITVVPPQTLHYLNTFYYFLASSLPADMGGNDGGLAMTAEVEYSGGGKVFIGNSTAWRDNTGVNIEHARTSGECTRIR